MELQLRIPIETDRLILRNLQESDFASVHRYASTPEVVRHCSFGPNTVEDTSAFLLLAVSESLEQPRSKYDLAITLKETGQLIGACGAYLSKTAPNCYTIGYILDSHCWGNGYATEAVKALVCALFRSANAHRVEAHVMPENIASARVLLKLGFRLEGRLRENLFVRDEWRSSDVYSLLRSEFFNAVARGLL